MSIRVSQLCLRSALLHHGNALRALGRPVDARASYLKVWPMLEPEPRCPRLDWERMSILVNLGDTHADDLQKACEYYDQAQQLGQDHVNAAQGGQLDGLGMVIGAARARCFCLQKVGDEAKAKEGMRQVLQWQLEYNNLKEEKQAEEKAALEAAKEQEDNKPLTDGTNNK